MKRLLVLLATVILAGELATVPDYVVRDRTFVTEDGKRVLEIRKDPVVKGQYRMYDDKGLVGTWKRDPILRDRYLFRKGQ